jgi:protein-S-isoprenylcysteine O-methyltransferase Ste14
MNRHVTGWVFVALQGVLLGALILLPGRDDWATPSWLRGAGYALILGGLALIAIAVGLTVRSGSFIHVAVAVTTVALFTVKAKWEEARLAERYPAYASYAALTPRFVPRLRCRSSVG